MQDPLIQPDPDDGCMRQIRDVGTPALLERPGGTNKPPLKPSEFHLSSFTFDDM